MLPSTATRGGSHSQSQWQQQADESSSDPESSSGEYGFDESTRLLVLPSKLTYSLDELDEATRDHFKHTVDMLGESPGLVLEECTSKEREINFWLTEPVERCVRIRQPGSPLEVLSCSCQDANDEAQPPPNTDKQMPCAHILWLLDQIAERTLDDQGSPLSLTEHGYASEMGNPHEKVVEFHLDMLADSLHCHLAKPSSADTKQTHSNDKMSRRRREARELLATLAGTPVAEYRPDLFDEPQRRRHSKRVVQKGDLEATILQILLHNNAFFNYLSTILHPHMSPVHDLEKRVDAALAGFDSDSDSDSDSDGNCDEKKDAEWCARHLALAEGQLGTMLQFTKRPLSDAWKTSVARLLLTMLEQVMARQSLHAALMIFQEGKRKSNNDNSSSSSSSSGGGHGNFAVGVLNKIPPDLLSGLVSRMESILERLRSSSVPAVPGSYVDRFARLVRAARGARVRDRDVSTAATASSSSSLNVGAAAAAAKGSKRAGEAGSGGVLGRDGGGSAKRRMK
jgi:hypothetical protein